jgi:hypothetical protein
MSNPRWDARCGEILRRMAGDYHDQEIAASIEAETGKRFMPRTVAEYRRAGDLPPCRRNDWTAPLKMWRAGATNVAIQLRREEMETEKRSVRLGDPEVGPGSTERDEPDEIEITPAMIEAGAEAIAGRYRGLDLNPSPSVVARSVFLAMLSKRSE